MRVLAIPLLFVISFVLTIVVGHGLNNATKDEDETSRLLSRRKRFLIYPDGSSFQLVFCTQTHGYLQIGDVVWFGNTAALAWELPTDPQIYHIFLKNKEGKPFAQRRQDVKKNIYYLDENGKVLAKVPYKKRPIVNPAFAKRSIDNTIGSTGKRYVDFIRQMHEVERNASYLTNMEDSALDFHRVGRTKLYKKLEKFIEALGWSGKECVLQLLCESGKEKTTQGSLFEELLRATFTLPKGRDFDSKGNKMYDVAHNSIGDCMKLYPNCRRLHSQAML